MDSRRKHLLSGQTGLSWGMEGKWPNRKRKKKKSCVKGSLECSSSCLPHQNHSWKGKQCVWPLKWSQDWKPQVGWTLAAARDPVAVAREEGWPVELLRTEKEDARPEEEKNGKVNKWQTPAELLSSREAFTLCDLYWLQYCYWINNNYCISNHQTPVNEGNFPALRLTFKSWRSPMALVVAHNRKCTLSSGAITEKLFCCLTGPWAGASFFPTQEGMICCKTHCRCHSAH